MRRAGIRFGIGLCLLGALVLGAGIARAGSDRPVLIRILAEDPDPLVHLPRLEAAGAAPARILGRSILAWGSERAVDLVRGAGFDAEAIGRRRPGRDYAIVHLADRLDGSAPQLESLGELLWRGEEAAVLAYPPDRIDLLAAHYDIVAIPDRPIRLSSAPRLPRRAFPAEADPAVLDLVRAVDADSLLRTALDLEAFGDRRSTGGGCHAATDYLLRRFRDCGLADVSRLDYSPFDWCDNVVAAQPGRSAPEEIVVICGHYDSISRSGPAPGADDNASGTAAVVEAARLLAPHEFEATILYIAFAGEEQGLVGSEAWARQAREEGLDIRAAINLDMIGYLPAGMAGDLDLIGGGISPELLDFAFATIPLYLPDHPLVAGFLSSGSSDHQSFWDNGYPAIFLHEDSVYRNPFYHTSNDRVGPSLNDFEFLARNVQSAVALLATLARPSRVRIAHEPIDDPPLDAAGYRIDARIESSAPLREDSLFVRYSADGGAEREVPMRAAGSPGRYEATLPPEAAGAEVSYHIFARDIEGRRAVDPPRAPAVRHRFIVGMATAFYDDFSRHDPGWIVGDPDDDATSGIWEWGVPIGTGAQPGADAESDSGGFCYFTGNGPPGGGIGDADVDGGRTTLTSPRIDLDRAIDYRISYDRWFVDETFPDDTLRVYLSNDDGATWIEVDATGESDRAWRAVRLEGLHERLAASGAMRLRFVAEDAGFPSLVEAAIDRVEFRAVRLPALPAEPASRLAVWPSPARDRILLSVRLPEEGSARLRAYDVRGREVAAVDLGRRSAGLHTFVWDAAGLRGEPLPAGIYFVRLIGPGGRAWTGRVAVAR